MRHYAFTGKTLGPVSTREPSRAPRTPQKDCVFCQIIASEGEENENENGKKNKREARLLFRAALVVFDDHRPAATRHYLICPRDHSTASTTWRRGDLELLDEMVRVAEKVVSEAAAEGGDRRRPGVDLDLSPHPSPPPPPPPKSNLASTSPPGTASTTSTSTLSCCRTRAG